MMHSFKNYRKMVFFEMRPYVDGEILPESISISEYDLENGSPIGGDMIARNPNDHSDQWLVAYKYFKDNFEEINNKNDNKIAS